MDLRALFGCLALMLAGFSLLQLRSIPARKLGVGAIWLASGLGAFFFSGSLFIGAAVLLAWIFFPLWEMLFVLRQLRVPRHRELTDSPPPRAEFEELSEITRALTQNGFRHVDECRLRPTQHEQYYRILLHGDRLTQAMIGYVAQGAIGFHFVAFTSTGRDGRRWVTWDYPLTYGLVMPPETAVYRALHCQDVLELHQAHLDFLAVNEVRPGDLEPQEETPEAARLQLAQSLNQQIEYNVALGYLAPAPASDEPASVCYSWRGTFYVAGQVLRDLLF